MIAAAQKLQSGNALEYNDNRVAQIPLGEGVDHNQVQFVQVCICMLYHWPHIWEAWTVTQYLVQALVHKQMYWVRTNLRRFQPSNVKCDIRMFILHYMSIT